MIALLKHASFWTAIGDTIAAIALIITCFIFLASRPSSLPQEIFQILNSTPTLINTLAINTSDGMWDERTTQFGSCIFKEKAYFITSQPQDTLKVCLSNHLIVSDFTLQIQIRIYQGDMAGIIFRRNEGKGVYNDYYYFFITTSGRYGVLKSVHQNCPGINCIEILYATPDHTINPGLGTLNTIAIIASDNKFYLSINGQYLCLVTDRSAPYYTGSIGLATGFDPSQAAFTNIKLWNHQTNLPN